MIFINLSLRFAIEQSKRAPARYRIEIEAAGSPPYVIKPAATDADGRAAFSLSIPVTLHAAVPPSFTATATSSEGATSEFSKPVALMERTRSAGVPPALVVGKGGGRDARAPGYATNPSIGLTPSLPGKISAASTRSSTRR